MSNFNDVLKQYDANNPQNILFHLTEAQYNIIRQLVRIELADLIDNDANDRVIDHFTALDVSLTTQYNNAMTVDDVDGDLPF